MKWTRIFQYLRWRFASHPVLLNPQTLECIAVSAGVRLPTGSTWILRRPLTLPESSQQVMLWTQVTAR